MATPTILADLQGDRVWSGIAKHPVAASGVLWLSTLNLSGDGQADIDAHGGPDKAVYSYPSEHLDAWAADLGDELGDAPFGENLSTVGALERDVRIGDIWEWGSAVLQVTQPRWPCFKLGLYRGRPDVLDRLRVSGRTGWYLRVLEPGEVPVAGPIRVVQPDPAGITVFDAHLAMSDRHMSDVERFQAIVEHPALADQWRAPLARRLEHRLATRPGESRG